MKRLVLVVLLTLLAACSTKPVELPPVQTSKTLLAPLVPDAQDPTGPKVTLHADTAFSPDERNVMDSAAEVWRLQTGGLAQVTFVYDLDFESISNIQDHVEQRHNLALKMESWMPAVKEMDGGPDPSVLGWIDVPGGIHNPWREPVTMALVTDRFPDRQYALAVVVHEMGHLLGLPHSRSVQDIMYPSVVKGRTSCLKGGDIAAFCSVYDCGRVKTYPCE